MGSRAGPSDAQLRVALESLSARLDDPSAPDLLPACAPGSTPSPAPRHGAG